MNLPSSMLRYDFLWILFVVSEVSPSEVLRPRGVSLSRASLYSADKDFTCLDGSQTIPFIRVNDDYCDCYDASDEPGTAACPHGMFHCTNAGHKPQNIPSNRVNDGICDCCDGTDEYATEKTCPNNCIELGRSAREAAKHRAELIKAGKQIREELIKKGVQMKLENEAKLTDLLKNKEEAEKLKQEKEVLKKDAEGLENVALDYYRKLEEEAKKKKVEEEAVKNQVEAVETFNQFDSNQDGVIDILELQSREAFDKDHNGEDAQIFKPPSTETEDTADEALHMQEEEEQEHDEETQDEEGDEEDEDHESEEPEATDNEDPASSSSTVKYDEETQRLIERANAARTDFQEFEKQLRNIENEIKEIKEYLEKDFGTEEEYATLQGQCFEYRDNEYVYKLCPFDKTSQQPLSGTTEVRLGSWGKWSGPESNIYEQMTYEKGQSCWNGPQRSSIVSVSCGGEHKVISVSEPNRCEYLFEFITPAACKETPGETHEDWHDEL